MGATPMGRVAVFSRADCVQCKATYRALDDRGIDYRIIDVDELGDDAAEALREMGFQRLPVVKVDGMKSWSGFRPDLVAEIPVDGGQA